MAFIEAIQQIFIAMLIGYIGITNALASHIQSLMPETDQTPIAIVERNTNSETPFEKIIAVAEKYSTSASKILLENAEFQRAAILSNKYEDVVAAFPEGGSIESTIENALVNIYCQYKTDKFIRTTTGTGFFINQKGVILTNAHVAQFLLLESAEKVVRGTECVIRAGSPATKKYKAKLLYISPTWIFENAKLIDAESPSGTGERDYALLYVSDSIDGTPLPARFPIITTDTELLSRQIAGASVLSAGYPAEKLIRNGADTDLLPVIALSSIETLYTFGSNYADIFSISGTPVGEHGASGGPVITSNNLAIGLIVTKGDIEVDGDNSLRALTLSYIDRTISEETGFNLAQNMQGDVALRGNVFKNAIVPFLTQLLEDELQ